MQRILLRSAARRQLHLARAKRTVGVSRRHSTTCTSHVISSRTVPLAYSRIKALQLRSFSTTVEDNYEMERFTTRILNHKTTPLGTMSAALVDDTITACQHWCSTGSGYGIDSADRLLQRLVCEHASGASAARQRTSAIADLQRQVLHSWLTLSAFRLALVKAESLLVNMVQWHQRGISDYDPFPEMVSVVAACLAYPDLAANLMLQWTQTPNSDTAKELVPLMNATLESCVQMNDAMMAALLLQRMETLETEYGWKNLILSSDARKLVMEGPMSVPNEEENELVIEEDEPYEDSGVKHLSDFELQAIQGRFVEFLQTASREDKNRVLEMAKQLNTLPQTDATTSLFKAFMDYFVKINDAKHATQLLSRMDVDGDADAKSPVNENLFLDVLRLWVSSRDVDSPWRVQEIVKRMEELERLGRLEVSTSTYNILCEAWAGSADPSAPRRIEAIFSRMLDARKNGVESKSPNLDSFKQYLSGWPKPPENHVKQVVSELMNQGAELGTEESWKIVEKSLEALSMDAPNATAKQLQDRGNIVSKLFRQAVSQGISVTPTMCINLIKTQQFEARLRELSYLERTGIEVPLECYSLTIMALIDARRSLFDQKKKVVAHTFNRYAEGKLSAKSSEMQALMICIMEELLRQGRPSPIDDMLRLFEELVLSDEAPVKDVEIPVECFNSTMTAWFFDHKNEKAEETYNRLISYYEAGHSSLAPNAGSVATMLELVISSSAPEKQVANKATKLFEDLLKRYEATGNILFKPTNTCFAHVLTALTRVSSPKAAEMSQDYLMKMVSMGLIPPTSSFNKVMFAIGRVNINNKLLRAEALLKQMEKVGVEPNHLTYKNIIRACLSSEPRRYNGQRALSCLMDATGKLRKMGEIDAGSYGMLAIALQTQLAGESDENRDKVAYTTCRLCYEDGFLNKQNSALFRKILSKKAWLKLTKKFNEIEGKSQATDQREDERMAVH